MTALHRTEIGMLERGEREPRLSTIIKLVGALEAPIHELAGGIAWKLMSRGPQGFEFRG